jgi:pyridoxine kinase
VSRAGSILSIQSHVAFGHVGNSAAILPLQRQGFEVLALNTVQLAHHPGYGAFSGAMTDPALLMTMLGGLERIGALDGCVAVLSGYLGTPAVGAVVSAAVQRVRACSAGAVFLCDPVLGDDDVGIFVQAGIPEVMREVLVPQADLLTPNAFELGLLSGRPIRDIASALEAAAVLRAAGPGLVVATGLPTGDPRRLGVLAAAAERAWLVTTPRREVLLHGTGDAFSALFLGHYLRTKSVPAALEAAASAMYALVERTVDAGSAELALIAAQDVLADPPALFRAERIA